VTLRVDEGVLYSDSLAKYAGFFQDDSLFLNATKLRSKLQDFLL
jgi:hypothetical protein